jgi:hypothetical protein
MIVTNVILEENTDDYPTKTTLPIAYETRVDYVWQSFANGGNNIIIIIKI